MVRLSIIVPVYNVSPYLGKCLDSLARQGLQEDEYEVIVVDDGSTDGSGNLADEFSSGHCNFRVIHQKNGGLSAARNTGIRAAKGLYVQFVDSDDFLQPDKLSGLLEKMESEGLDVLRFNFQNVNSEYQVFEPYKQMKPFADFSDSICDGRTFLEERLGFECYAVQFIIRSEIAKECLFEEKVLFEDTRWTPTMLRMAGKVTSTDDVVYNYLRRDGSITRAMTLESALHLIGEKIALASFLSMESSVWYGAMRSRTVQSALDDIAKYAYPKRAGYLERIASIGAYPLTYEKATDKLKKKFRIINLSPSLYCRLMHLKTKL